MTGYGANGCNVWDGFNWTFQATASWRKPGFEQTDRDPVVCVSINDANAYIAWYSRTMGKSYRLPSESEWEYAARAGTTTSRYWGDDIAQQCLYADGSSLEYSKAFPQEPDVNRACTDGFLHTSPVGSFRQNPWGLYDMLGDVWQWTADCAHKGYVGAPTDGSAWTGTCKYHRYRGGSWYDGPSYLRAAMRNGGLPDQGYNGVGFRLAAAVPVDTRAREQELLDTDRALAAQSLKIGFVPAYEAVMASDARKLDPGSQPALGRQAILEVMAHYSKSDTFTWAPEEAVVAVSGELGFTWGRWTDTYRDKHGNIKHAYGKYLDVWRRDADGTWRWTVDSSTSCFRTSPKALRNGNIIELSEMEVLPRMFGGELDIANAIERKRADEAGRRRSLTKFFWFRDRERLRDHRTEEEVVNDPWIQAVLARAGSWGLRAEFQAPQSAERDISPAEIKLPLEDHHV